METVTIIIGRNSPQVKKLLGVKEKTRHARTAYLADISQKKRLTARTWCVTVCADACLTSCPWKHVCGADCTAPEIRVLCVNALASRTGHVGNCRLSAPSCSVRRGTGQLRQARASRALLAQQISPEKVEESHRRVLRGEVEVVLCFLVQADKPSALLRKELQDG